jgi:Xaa-Pro aminopeptidase
MNEKIRCLREKIRGRSLDGMIISNPVNIKYLTNITSEGILLLTRKENIFITYTMFIDAVNSVLTINDDIIVMDFRSLTKEDYENFFIFCENVGFEERYVTYNDYQNIKAKYKPNNLIETEGIIEKQRMIKDEEEIENIKKACEITDNCFTHIVKFIKKGMTEKEIAFEIDSYFRKNGADGRAFETIVAVGENSANPHWVPSDRKVKMSDPILIDMGCTYNGYASDMTRTIFMGCMLEEIKRVYDLVLKNKLLTEKEATDGYSIKTFSQTVESDFKINNYDLIHSLGHGVGLEVHELPFINSRNESILRTNMAIAVEPAIYIPGKFGVRIEDTLLVTKNGCITLTKSDKNYTVI